MKKLFPRGVAAILVLLMVFAFAACGVVYEARLDDSFVLASFEKIASLTAEEVSTDELPSFDLVYKYGDKVFSLYIIYYPVDYLGESAGYAEIRLADMSSERGSLPFNG